MEMFDKYLKGQGREIHKKPLRFINSIGYTRVGTRVDLCNNCLVIGPRGGDEHYLALDIEGNDYARSALSQDIRCFEITRSGISDLGNDCCGIFFRAKGMV